MKIKVNLNEFLFYKKKQRLYISQYLFLFLNFEKLKIVI